MYQSLEHELQKHVNHQDTLQQCQAWLSTVQPELKPSTWPPFSLADAVKQVKEAHLSKLVNYSFLAWNQVSIYFCRRKKLNNSVALHTSKIHILISCFSQEKDPLEATESQCKNIMLGLDLYTKCVEIVACLAPCHPSWNKDGRYIRGIIGIRSVCHQQY